MSRAQSESVAASVAHGEGLTTWTQWLLASGVQAHEGHFYDWFDLGRGKFHRPYPEITGYGLSTLLWLFARTRDSQFLEHAREACEWLHSVALDPRWHLVRAWKGSEDGITPDPYLYAFDSGVIAAGLVRLAIQADDRHAREMVERIRGTFRECLRRGDGTLWPLVDMRTQSPVSGTAKWSHRFSGYQIKTLAFFPLSHGLGAEAESADGGLETIERVLEEQRSDGAFPGLDSGETHLHPHLYALEGLVIAACAHARADWFEAVERGYGYARRLFLAYGSLPTRAVADRVTVSHERTDILAQFLRLGSYLASVGAVGGPRERQAMEDARRRLLAWQVPDGPQRGGFLFGVDIDGSVKDHVSSCASLFAGQALSWFERERAGEPIDPLELV